MSASTLCDRRVLCALDRHPLACFVSPPSCGGRGASRETNFHQAFLSHCKERVHVILLFGVKLMRAVHRELRLSDLWIFRDRLGRRKPVTSGDITLPRRQEGWHLWVVTAVSESGVQTPALDLGISTTCGAIHRILGFTVPSRSVVYQTRFRKICAPCHSY